ncbi:hypothetical protein [Spiroplasma endosymbiont of Danaus chrysippus]|uniref:hypothetical protein n=1 Tax=Spiroplasma endosymbiont of Danaus chrysippus TaxID=2691041 RepID=UPI00157B71C1|nr:hypothetical protein [Spiroplasma endosymbiont of Danaus chrysippus]
MDYLLLTEIKEVDPPMTVFYIMLVPLSLAWIAFSLHLINLGWELCEKNNPFGIVLFTISLNIIGTVIGAMIMYKSQHPEFKFWKSLGNKVKKMFKFKKRNKKIAI